MVCRVLPVGAFTFARTFHGRMVEQSSSCERNVAVLNDLPGLVPSLEVNMRTQSALCAVAQRIKVACRHSKLSEIVC